MIQIFQGRCIPELHDLYDLYDLAHVAGWEPYSLHDLQAMFPGLDLYYTCPAQHPMAAGHRICLI